jgi:CBS domain containing-hemolysin-like protein
MAEPDAPEGAASEAPGSRPSLVEVLRHWLRGLLGGGDGETSLREALGELIEETDATAAEIDPQERALLSNILKLHGQTVDDVKVPRADIAAAAHDLSLDRLLQLMGEKAHSRLPVYRESLDDILGMVHIKDALAWLGRKEEFEIAKILRPVLFIAPSMRVLDLLLKMRATRQHLALVVDEFGGIDGLVTIEDLVEEIVGEIEDEHGAEARPLLSEAGAGTLIADARVPLEEFEARVGPVLPAEEREDIDTVGGLVFALAGRIPARGEVIVHSSGLEFEVIDADPRRIKQLRVRNLPPPPAPGP